MPKGERQVLRMENFAALLKGMTLFQTSYKEFHAYTVEALSNHGYLGGEKLRGYCR